MHIQLRQSGFFKQLTHTHVQKTKCIIDWEIYSELELRRYWLISETN